ncbi:glycosyltransferase family 4 protein [Sphingomonas corticis]|jgi:glycosyltransferase involved in cell wall biosynthesis|uniref:Glycosyltransferase family 4 protein n=1 Tax=Sphingomonas corticis TaxID=2722791 RepID=A0ABX1CSI3_9SPHN|nr:glycosyltransferase family 4 protein [Sphingomonas corticis]NJR79372.1 glycosyltransferase family 4 protein [Sphingomonas corticis]
MEGVSVLQLNTLISLPMTNGGPSYTCERVVAAMEGHGVRARLYAPADRRTTIGTSVAVESVIPRWARRWPFRAGRPVTNRLSERRLLAACRTRGGKSAAFLWGNVSVGLMRGLEQTGCLIAREKFNCAQAVSRRIVYDAYRSLDALKAFPTWQYSDRSIAAEMESLRRAHLIFCPSPMVAETLRVVGIEEERLARTSYGLDPARLSGTTSALPPVDVPTFLFTGYICVRKGAHILLDAWRRMEGAGRLVLLGRMEPLIAARFADVLARPDVEHHAFTQDVGAFYRSADFFVFPTLEEGSPLVTYEAAFCGLASLVTPMGAGDIIADGVEGVVLDSADPERWAELLSRAAQNVGQARDIGARAHERAMQFTWDRVGRQRREILLERVGA